MIKRITPPNPGWKPGDKISSPVSTMVSVDPAKLEIPAIYKLMVGAIVPRPIAFVSTISSDGKANLAPFSFFSGVGSNPPSVMFAVVRKPDNSKKDTLRNIEETKQFVVNFAADFLAEPLNHCSGTFPYGISEFKESGLTEIQSVKVLPPRVKESPVHLECELYDTMQVGDGGVGSSTIVVGRIVLVHVYDKAYKNGILSLEELRPISRLGGFDYGITSEVFDLPRPKI